MSKKKSHSTKRWVKYVTTDSTHPPQGTFEKPAAEVARIMARKDVSPGGLGSAIRMVQYFINRGGKGLTKTRKQELEKAKRLLQQMRDDEQSPPASKLVKKKGAIKKPAKRKSSAGKKSAKRAKRSR
jgi:tRNA(adenine34) deaminase